MTKAQEGGLFHTPEITMTPTKTNTQKANNPEAVAKATKLGNAQIAEGKTKVEATRAMYPLIKDESREIICQAFVDGAGLTERGAMTYFYNVVRHFKKPSKPT